VIDWKVSCRTWREELSPKKVEKEKVMTASDFSVADSEALVWVSLSTRNEL
jgi:hypothetical protein